MRTLGLTTLEVKDNNDSDDSDIGRMPPKENDKNKSEDSGICPGSRCEIYRGALRQKRVEEILGNVACYVEVGARGVGRERVSFSVLPPWASDEAARVRLF